jgi:hypothetical protein
MAVALGLFIAMSRDLCVCFDLNPRRNNIHVEIHSLSPRRPVSILDAISPISFIILPSSLFLGPMLSSDFYIMQLLLNYISIRRERVKTTQ